MLLFRIFRGRAASASYEKVISDIELKEMKYIFMEFGVLRFWCKESISRLFNVNPHTLLDFVYNGFYYDGCLKLSDG